MIFEPFAKIPRLSRECVITEKIDGTNASVIIMTAVELEALGHDVERTMAVASDASRMQVMFAASRTRLVTPGKQDNYGFAGWVKDHASELFELGPGGHFGEWWGQKIQRGYGLSEKRFSLFNTSKWADRYAVLSAEHDEGKGSILREGQSMAPACCSVVPVLYQGPFDTVHIESTLFDLQVTGSVAAPGFMNPEGVVIYHVAGNLYFKKTIEKDEAPKGVNA